MRGSASGICHLAVQNRVPVELQIIQNFCVCVELQSRRARIRLLLCIRVTKCDRAHLNAVGVDHDDLVPLGNWWDPF